MRQYNTLCLDILHEKYLGKQYSTWNTPHIEILCNEKYMRIDKYERYSNI